MIHVDIIVPTYKREGLLRESLESVQKQTYSNWTCWVAEDGESLETFNALELFLEDTRFQYLPGLHSGSPVKPRNRALLEGGGELIAFLDDDDVWLPEKLEKQVNFLNNNKKCVLLGSNAYRLKENAALSSMPLYFKKMYFLNQPIPYKQFLKCNYMINSSVMVRRKNLSKAGLFNEDKNLYAGEDHELWLRIASLGEVWLINEPLLFYRETPQKFYMTLSREDDYKYKAYVLDLVLQGDLKTPSPLSLPENKKKADLCRNERDYRFAGPNFCGRFRYVLKRILSCR